MKNDKEYVTINCDAGFKDGHVTFGVWISSCQGPYKFYGEAKEKYENSTEAELVAICTSVYRLSKLDCRKFMDILVINTDSKSAIDILRSRSKKYKKFWSFYDNLIDDMKMIKHFEISLRHVKGHSRKVDSEKSKRKFVNNWCDKMATQVRKNKI